MKAVFCALVVLTFTYRSLAETELVPAVTISTGSLRGSALGAGAVFKGIPFAAPPVGDLRWREPMPVKPWSGVRDATLFGPRCMQGGQDAGEECLYLDV